MVKFKRKGKRRSVAIIGISTFGYYLCKYLSDAGVEILAVDMDEKRVDAVKSFVHKAVIADARDRKVLRELGIEEMDEVVVSVGEDIAASILIVVHLRDMGIRDIVAKATSEDHARVLELIGASEIFFPERDTALRVAYTLYSPKLLDFISLEQDYSIVEFCPPSSWSGKTLAELDLRRNYQVQVIMVKETVPENFIMIPGGDYVVKDSDVLTVLGKNEDLQKLERVQ
ncbi:MAG: TrkA family potassium uptake protein [Calditrichaeota bacterium]|nr:MAG: TrkA family potassium uptake protein [Calditrichota bacterium]